MEGAARSRTIGIVYALYFITAVAGVAAARLAPLAGEAFAVLSTAVYAALVLLFYRLFERWNRPVALAMASAGLIGCGVQAFAILMKMPHGAYAALVFFGVFNLLLGYLIANSTVIPRIFGVLMAIAGLGWLTFVFPQFALRFATYTEGTGGVVELALMLWLLLRGTPNAEAPSAPCAVR